MMKKIIQHISFVLLLLTMTGCYGYRQIGLLQEREDLPQYDSAAYEPYRLQVNDEIIYRVVTMDETIAKTLSANNNMQMLIEFTRMVRWTSHSYLP